MMRWDPDERSTKEERERERAAALVGGFILALGILILAAGTLGCLWLAKAVFFG